MIILHSFLGTWQLIGDYFVWSFFTGVEVKLDVSIS